MRSSTRLPLQAEYDNCLLRRVNLSSGLVVTLAGNVCNASKRYADGVGTAASFYVPKGVAMDSAGSVAAVVSLKAIGVK